MSGAQGDSGCEDSGGATASDSAASRLLWLAVRLFALLERSW